MARNKEKQYARFARVRAETRKFIDDYKSHRGCYFCSISNPIVLDFHHVNPSEKLFGISAVRNRYPSRERLLSEMNKCEVVCANCHRLLEAGQLAYTHKDNTIPQLLKLV